MSRPNFAQAVVSTLIFYLTLGTTGLLLLVALFTVRRRTLHDLLRRACGGARSGVDPTGRVLEHAGRPFPHLIRSPMPKLQ